MHWNILKASKLPDTECPRSTFLASFLGVLPSCVPASSLLPSFVPSFSVSFFFLRSFVASFVPFLTAFLLSFLDVSLSFLHAVLPPGTCKERQPWLRYSMANKLSTWAIWTKPLRLIRCCPSRKQKQLDWHLSRTLDFPQRSASKGAQHHRSSKTPCGRKFKGLKGLQNKQSFRLRGLRLFPVWYTLVFGTQACCVKPPLPKTYLCAPGLVLRILV